MSEPGNYSGTLAYEDADNGELEVRRFALVGDDLVVFEFVTPEYIDDEDTRLLGVAEINEDDGYESPWIYLTREDGSDFDDDDADYAAVLLTVTDNGDGTLQVEGVWYDSDEEEYAFSGTLQRD